jgi:hypothetical protein
MLKEVVVPGQSERHVKTHRLGRFRTDFQKRYSQPAEISLAREPAPVDLGTSNSPEQLAHARLPALPPEIGVLLTMVGTAGVVLPGVVGAPFLLAGGIALWPSAFRKVETWLMKAAPGIYETGVQQIEQFLADLERRYPNSAP